MIQYSKLTSYLPEKFDVLQVTETGSQIWKMDNENSDHDLVVIYRERTKDILRGRTYHGTLPSKHHIIIDSEEFDISYLEIGHFCHQLKKGNINMIWSLLSPNVVYRDNQMLILRDIVSAVHTDSIIDSGVGMTMSQLKDAEKRSDVRLPKKSLRCAFRTIQFVKVHLFTGQWQFQPAPSEVTEEMVRDVIDDVLTFQTNNTLDVMPMKDIENWLLHLRVSQL